MELDLEAGIDGPGILGMYWYETVLALGRLRYYSRVFSLLILIANPRRKHGGGTWDSLRGVGP
jgi:hypothetical protein